MREDDFEVYLRTVSYTHLLAIFFGAFIFFAAGGPTLGLGMTQLGSIMLPVAFVEGILAGYSLDDTMKNFVKGTQSMCGVMVFMVLASIMSCLLYTSFLPSGSHEEAFPGIAGG